MDAQTLFNAVISVASILGGIMLKSIYDAITERYSIFITVATRLVLQARCS